MSYAAELPKVEKVVLLDSHIGVALGLLWFSVWIPTLSTSPVRLLCGPLVFFSFGLVKTSSRKVGQCLKRGICRP